MDIKRAFLGTLWALSATSMVLITTANAERLWSRSSIDWTPRVVSLGLRGTQVFGPVEFGQDHVGLYSGFSPDPALPLWTHNLAIAGSNIESASAETSDIHALVTQVVQNNNNSTRQTVLNVYNSQSPTPLWSYTFPGISSGLAKVGMSADGSRIVATLIFPMESRLAVAVFNSNSSTPISTFNVNPFSTHLKGFIVSADGRTLYLSSATMAYIYNLDNSSVVYQTILPTMMDSHALCGNGQAFAYGMFNGVKLFQKNASGTYTNTWTGNFPGSIVADRLAMSDDCSTLIYGLHEYSQNQKFIVEALDIQSKQVLMHDECTGTGTFQNVISKIDSSADGSRFAVGAWGDGGGICSELRVYDRNTNLPIYQYNYPGSVYSLDMSADGKRVAAAVKPVHANTFAGGGSFDLHAVEADELRIVGIPRAGSTVSVRLSGLPANSSTKLLRASTVLEEPVYMGSMGYLFLPRLTTTPITFTNTNAQGEATGTFNIPAGLAGQDIFLQAIALMPRRLTDNFEQIRILP